MQAQAPLDKKFVDMMEQLINDLHNSTPADDASRHFDAFTHQEYVEQFEAFTKLRYYENDMTHLPLYYEDAKREATKELIKKFIIEHQGEYLSRVRQYRESYPSK